MSDQNISREEIKQEFLKINSLFEEKKTDFIKFEDYGQGDRWYLMESKIHNVLSEFKFIVDIYNNDYRYLYTATDMIEAFKDASSEMNNNIFWMFWGFIISRLDFIKRYSEDMVALTQTSHKGKSRLEHSLYQRTLDASYMIGNDRLNFEKMISKLQEFEDDYPIKIYRGFKVREDRKIKDDDGKHLEGRGISYSFSKQISRLFAMENNSFWHVYKFFKSALKNKESILEKHDAPMVDDDEFLIGVLTANLKGENMNTSGVSHFSYELFLRSREYRQGLFDITNKDNRWFTNFRKIITNFGHEHHKINERFYDTKIGIENQRSYFGTFEVIKKDILIGLNRPKTISEGLDKDINTYEQEVVVSPDKVKMLRYEVINIDNVNFWYR